MAIYRNVQTSFWGDYFVTKLPAEEKYFYLYLLTNTRTSQCGIYELPDTFMAMETGCSQEAVNKFLEKFQKAGKISYNVATGEIMILNWIKYNFINSRNTILCINKELRKVKNKEYLRILYRICREEGYDTDVMFNGLMLGDVTGSKEEEVGSMGDIDESYSEGRGIADERASCPSQPPRNREGVKIYEATACPKGEAVSGEEIRIPQELTVSEKIDCPKQKEEEKGTQKENGLTGDFEAPCKPLGEKETLNIYINNNKQKVIYKTIEEENRNFAKVVNIFCKKIGEPSVEQVKSLKSWFKNLDYRDAIKAINHVVGTNCKRSFSQFLNPVTI